MNFSRNYEIVDPAKGTEKSCSKRRCAVPFQQVYSYSLVCWCHKMMNESEENIEISNSPAAANPFDEPDKEEETEPTTPASTNPFEMEDVEENLPQNPFDQEDHDADGTKADYEYVSLVTPAVEVGKAHNRDWDLEWDHVSNAVKKNFTSVSVVAPEVISSMMSKHVVYTVKTEPQKYVVRRRYNDFAWLRDTLAATYEGLFIPSIPATTIFSSKTGLTGGSKTDVNGDFVKNRMLQLHLFLQQLSSIPFLRTDPSLHSFLSVQNEKEFKQLTESPLAVANGGGTDNYTNVGLSMWLKLVDNTPTNAVEAERLVGDFKRQLDILGATLNAVDSECRAAGRKAVASAAGLGSLTDQVAHWAGVENDLIDPNRNEYIDPSGKAKKAHMDALTIGQQHWAQSAALVPKILARLLLSNVQFQLVQVARFKEHLQARDALLKELDRAERERHKAADDKQRSISPSQANKRQSRTSMMFHKGPEELDDILTKKTEQVAVLTARANRLTKGLTFCEIHRFNKDRLTSITTMLGTLTATHLQMAQSTANKWNDIAAQMGVEVGLHAETVSTLVSSAALDEDQAFNSEAV